MNKKAYGNAVMPLNEARKIVWGEIFGAAKECLLEIIQNKAERAQARVTACKCVMDTLSKVAPHVLKERESAMTMEDAATEILVDDDASGDKATVN